MGEGYAAFFESFGKIDTVSIENFKTLAEALQSFAAAGVADIFGALDLEEVGKQLNDFAPHIVTLSETLSQVDTASLAKLSITAHAMSGFGEFLEALPREGGIVGSILGDHQSLETFANGIGPFGEGLKRMMEALPAEGIDVGVVETAKQAGLMLTEIQNALPARGGKLQEWIGDKETLSTFATRLPSLAEGLVAFSNTIAKGNFDSSKTEGAAKAAKALADVQDAMPDRGGKLQEWIGEEETISAFSTRLPALAEGLVSFSNKISEGNFNDDTVVKAANAAKALAAVQNDLPDVGGKLADWFGDQQDLGTFGNNLRSLGEGLWWFSFYAEQLDEGAVKSASTITEELVKIANTLGGDKGLLKSIFKDQNDQFKKFGGALEQFGGSFKLFSDTISDIDWDGAQKAVNVIDQLVSSMQNLDGFANLQAFGNSLEVLGLNGVEAFTNAFESADAHSLLVDAGNTLIDGIRQSITSGMYDDMDTAATRVVGAFFVYFTARSIEKADGVAESLMDTIKGSIITASAGGALETAGKFVVEGIQRGIDRAWSDLKTHMAEKAQEIAVTFRYSLRIQSPSKVMRDEVGVYIVQGIAEGITQDMSAEDAAKKKAENIVNAFKEIFDRLDLELKGIQLDFEFEALVSPFRSANEIKTKDIELKMKEVEYASKNLETATAELRATAKEFGEGTDEYLEAENKFKEAQVNLAKESKELAELQSSLVDPSIGYENGQLIIKGFMSGLTADMSAEDAASQKAQNIVAAFEKEFENYDYSAGLRDAQKNLWDLFNPEYNENIQGRGLTDSEKEQAEIESRTQQMLAKIIKLRQDMATQAERYKLAEAEYNAYLASGIKDEKVERELINQKTEAYEQLASLANELYSQQEYLPAWERANAILEQMSQEDIDNFFNNIPETNPILQFVTEALDAAKDFGDIQFDYENYFTPLIDSTAFDDASGKVKVFYQEELPATITGSIGYITAAAAEAGEAGVDAYLSAWYDANAPAYLEALANGDISGLMGITGNASTDIWSMVTGGNVSAADATRVLQPILDGAKSVTDELGITGENGVLGYVQGMTSQYGLCKTTGEGLGNATIDGIMSNKSLDESSPSKAMYDIGEYAVIGFCNGLLKLLYMAGNAGSAIGDEALSSVQGVVSRMDQVLQGNLDVAPTISPVLDISNLQYGAEQIDKLFNTRQTYQIAAQAYMEAEESRIARERAVADMIVNGIGARIEGIGASLDDLREVIESHGDSDLIIDVNVDGASFARMTVEDYLYASRANGTPFYEANLF